MTSPESTPGEPTSEKIPSFQKKSGRTLAALALAGVVAGGSIFAVTQFGEKRHAPESAAYSLDANPLFYENIKAVNSDRAGFAAAREKLENQAVAAWLPNNLVGARKTVSEALSASAKDGSIPMFVNYAIPNRDLGGQSAGGLDAAGYRSYVKGVSEAIGKAPAIVVVEPDALAHLPDLEGAERTERAQLLAETLDTFYMNEKTAVYLDAGNSAWRSPEETAALIKEVADKTKHGVAGISLNVSNFQSDAATRAYAAAIEKAYGKKLYILIDSSRNGGKTDPAEWCNPDGQRLGTADNRFDADAKVEEAFIKTPGESDGVCGISTQPAGGADDSLLLHQLLG